MKYLTRSINGQHNTSVMKRLSLLWSFCGAKNKAGPKGPAVDRLRFDESTEAFFGQVKGNK
jgi:hypothetical protein